MRGIAGLKALAREQLCPPSCAARKTRRIVTAVMSSARQSRKDDDFAVAHIDKAGELKTQAALAAELKPRQLDMLF